MILFSMSLERNILEVNKAGGGLGQYVFQNRIAKQAITAREDGTGKYAQRYCVCYEEEEVLMWIEV